MRMPGVPRPGGGAGRDTTEQARRSAQAWLPLRDLHDGCVVRRDGAVVAGLAISPIDLALRSEAEREAVVDGVRDALGALQAPWELLSLERPVDLDSYLGDLDRALRDAAGSRRQALRDYAGWVTSLALAGGSVERRHHLLVVRDGPDAVAVHRAQMPALAQDLGRVRGLRVRVMDDADWRELLFLAFHGARAAVEPVPDGLPAVPPVWTRGGGSSGGSS